MREIKFRAWCEGIMFYNVRVGGFDVTRPTVFTSDGEWVNLEMIEGDEIMQFTGLKDKNGKDIYEGDIIKGDLYDCRLPTMGQVVFDNHFLFFANKNDAGNTALYKINNIETIGNIYQNPELIG